MDLLTYYIATNLPKPEGKEDWQYRDLPWMKSEYWEHLMDIIGKENVSFIVGNTKRFDDGLYMRGQVFVSPQGIKNVSEHIKVARQERSCSVCNP